MKLKRIAAMFFTVVMLSAAYIPVSAKTVQYGRCHGGCERQAGTKVKDWHSVTYYCHDGSNVMSSGQAMKLYCSRDNVYWFMYKMNCSH